MESAFQRIGIVMAMQKEAAPVIKKFGLSEKKLKNSKLPIKVWIGRQENVAIYLVHNLQDARYGVDLIGSQPAVLASNYLAENFWLDVIISAGTAGGLQSKGARIGDVYLSQGEIKFHDRRYPLPGFREYGVGSFPSINAFALSKHIDCKLGCISTGDSLYMSLEEQSQFEANEGEIKDMEAAAVAWVSHLHGVPFLAVKAITDFLDHPFQKTEEQFVQNFHEVLTSLTEKLWMLVELQSSRTHGKKEVRNS